MDIFTKIKSWNKEQSLNRQFSNLGEAIARRPLYYLIIPIIVTVVLSTGLLQVEINRNYHWLYSDTNGKAVESRKLVERLFPLNTSLYNDYSRIISTSEFTVLYITAKDEGSVLREDVVNDLLTMIHTIKGIEVQWKGKMTNFSVLCGRAFGQCVGENSIEVISNFPLIPKGKYKIKYPITIDKLTYSYKEYASLLGGVKLDNDGYVEDVKAVRITFFYDYRDHTKIRAIETWETLVYNYVMKNDLKHLEIFIVNDRSAYKSSKTLTLAMLKVFPIVVGTCVLFSALTCMTDEWATSRPWLGILACISALLAIISGFGFAFYLGVPYLDCFLVVVYIVLATEVDDALMLIASWRTTNPEDTVAKRMRQTFYETATSVTVSSLTNIISCCVGIATSVPVFRMLCMVAVCCGFFAYIYQLTFFGACLALSGYNEDKSMFSAICANKERRMKNGKKAKKTKKGDIFMLSLKNSFGNLLTYPLVKIIVILAFVANLATAIWGCTYIKYGMGLLDLFPSNSSITKAVRVQYKYFGNYPQPIHVVIKGTLNYADSEVQSSIESLIKQFESHPHIGDSQFRVSWLTFYKKLIENPVGAIAFRGYNMSDKQDFIDGLRHVFLRINNAIQFNFDINFNENYTDIEASRFILITKDINSTESDVETIKDLYEIASKSDLPVEIFGLAFHWFEQAWIVKTTTLQTASIAVGLSCLIFLAFSQNIRSSLCVAFVVLCMICEMIGYLSLWNVNIDFASLVVFIVSVGFSINYPAHMAFAFITDGNLESSEQIKNSVYRIGVPLIQGTLSTIFSLCVLIFQPVYALVSCFKILCLIAVLTIFNSLLFIPVILDLTGRCSKPSSRAVPRRSSLTFSQKSIESIPLK